MPRGGKRPGAGRKPGSKNRTTVKLGKGQTVSELARAHTADALQALIDVATGEKVPPSARVAAAAHLLARGWGQPKDDDAPVAPIPVSVSFHGVAGAPCGACGAEQPRDGRFCSECGAKR